MFKNLIPMLAVAALFGATMSAAPAMAQTNLTQPSNQGVNYSDSELKTYAVAALEVQQINQAYVQQRASIEGPDEQKALRKQAMDEMIDAIRDHGISLEKYNRITVESGENPELANEISQIMQQMQ